MQIDMTGKVAVVTGASKGIGLATARVLAEAGAAVLLTSRKPDALEEAAASVVAAVLSTSPRRSCHASVIAASSCRKLGWPCRGWAGK